MKKIKIKNLQLINQNNDIQFSTKLATNTFKQAKLQLIDNYDNHLFHKKVTKSQFKVRNLKSNYILSLEKRNQEMKNKLRCLKEEEIEQVCFEEPS